MHIGYINEELLEEGLPAPDDGIFIDKMGPEGMRNCFEDIVDALGYDKETMIRQKPLKGTH